MQFDSPYPSTLVLRRSQPLRLCRQPDRLSSTLCSSRFWSVPVREQLPTIWYCCQLEKRPFCQFSLSNNRWPCKKKKKKSRHPINVNVLTRLCVLCLSSLPSGNGSDHNLLGGRFFAHIAQELLQITTSWRHFFDNLIFSLFFTFCAAHTRFLTKGAVRLFVFESRLP